MQSDSLSGSSNPVTEGLISITPTSSSSSSSSSSSDGSFDLLLELNNTKNDDLENATPKLEQETPSSPIPVLENSTQVNDWNTYNSPVKQSPPIQTMGRPNNIPGYDPNRIPSTIFASKPTSAMDWSVASNESLFSIHMGNNSFSGDHAILLGKSGELYNFDDLISSVPSQQPKPNEVNSSPYNLPKPNEVNSSPYNLPKPNEVNSSPYNLPTVIETTPDIENNRQSMSAEENLSAKKGGDITPKMDMKVRLEDHHKETLLSKNSSNISDGRETPTRDSTRTSDSTQRLSYESGTNSSNSFAFPVLTSETGNCAPVKATHENVHPRHIEKPKIEPQPEPYNKPTPKASGIRWFSWFRLAGLISETNLVIDETEPLRNRSLGDVSCLYIASGLCW